MNKYLKVRKGAQQKHFRQRAFERLGFYLAEEEVSNIRSDIQSGTSTLLTRHSLRNSIWRVNIGNRGIIVVYDEETEELVTILTEGMWQARGICNSPTVANTKDLQAALGDHPAAKVLKELKGSKS